MGANAPITLPQAMIASYLAFRASVQKHRSAPPLTGHLPFATNIW
jgi:hypothetical protein